MSANDTTEPDVVHDPSWFVEDFDAAHNALAFVRADRKVVARQAFLDHRWNRAGFERHNTPLASLALQMPQAVPPPAANVIWHTSFCCSTLIAELLNVPGRCLALREPLVLVSMADAKRAGRCGGPPVSPRLVDVVLRLLQRTAVGERLVVKPSNFANNLIEDVARHAQGRMLFLYADLESFLVSIEKGGDGLGKYVRRLFGNLMQDQDGPSLPWPVHEILLMSDLEIAALCWHLQIQQFDRAARTVGWRRVAALDCADFLADPPAVLTAIASFFDLGLSRQQITDIVDGPILKRHAKQPAYPFDAARRRELAADVRLRLGRDLRRIVDWSFRACPGAHGDTALSPVRLGPRRTISHPSLETGAV